MSRIIKVREAKKLLNEVLQQAHILTPALADKLINMEEKQLPPSIEVEIEKRMLELIPPELCFEGDQTYDLAASKRYEVENVIVAYATKLHQANEVIKVLTYDNNRLKGEVDGLTSALDELRTKYDNILATESGHESKTENVWQSGYAAGHDAASERGKWEAQPGAVWVKAEKVRDSIGIPYHAKDEESKGAGTFDVNGHFTWGDGSITFRHCQDDLLILDESAAGITQDAHEKEVMMQAFDKVRQIFVGRQWIMEGRGSYPYNDDRYQHEVRHMYNEFDQVVKDTWANIKSKSADYRKAIIAEYLESAAGREEDKAHFDNWHRWLSDNGYTYDGEYYYDEDNNYFTPDQLWVKFK